MFSRSNRSVIAGRSRPGHRGYETICLNPRLAHSHPVQIRYPGLKHDFRLLAADFDTCLAGHRRRESMSIAAVPRRETRPRVSPGRTFPRTLKILTFFSCNYLPCNSHDRFRYFHGIVAIISGFRRFSNRVTLVRENPILRRSTVKI